MNQNRQTATGSTLTIGAAVGMCLIFEAAHAGTVMIAVTPGVADQVRTAAEAYEAVYPDDRVRLVVGRPERMKEELMGWPVQLMVSEDEALVSWMEERGVVGRNGAEPAVHQPLAVVSGAESASGVASLATLSDRMRNNDARIAILDPQKTDCGRRAQALLDAMRLGDDWKRRVVIAKNTEDAMALVRQGKAQFAVLFAPDAVTREGIAVHALSTPHQNASVHRFAVKRGQQDHAVAKRFLSFVKTPDCQQALTKRGYEVLLASGAVGATTVAQATSTQAGGARLQ